MLIARIKYWLGKETRQFFSVDENTRTWHIPLLAALGMAIPLYFGLYFRNLPSGLLAGMGGMMALYYIPELPIVSRMGVVASCSFLYLLCTAMGALFSFNPLLSSCVLALVAFGVQWLKLFFRVKGPGSFFFVIITSLVSCMPYERDQITIKVGLVCLGLGLTFLILLCYSIIPLKKKAPVIKQDLVLPLMAENSLFCLEAGIFGLFIGISLLVAHSMGMRNPYWVPISCCAVMQGTSKGHIGRRALHRIVGTLVGLCICWGILSLDTDPKTLCVCIVCLQFIVEMLVLRHYALAVVFITAMTTLLTEAADPHINNLNSLMLTRLLNICIGSTLGVVGGWFIYEKISLSNK